VNKSPAIKRRRHPTHQAFRKTSDTMLPAIIVLILLTVLVATEPDLGGGGKI